MDAAYRASYDDGSGARPRARAHPRRRSGLCDRSRRQRSDDHDLRSWRAHSAALDAPDPGDARGPRDLQRAERDVRRGDGVLHGGEAGRHPPRPPHLRHDVLSGARPAQRVRRASLQGALRLRAQRARRRRALPAREPARHQGTPHLRAVGAGRSPRRRHPRHRRRRGRGQLRLLHLPSRRRAARAWCG